MGNTRMRGWHSMIIAFSMLVTMVVVLPHAPAQSATLVVDGAGTCSDASPSPAFCTIGAAVGASSNGDVITVAPATYTERLSLGSRILTIRSTGGASVTTLNPPAPNDLMVGVNTGTITLDGFTLSGGARGASNPGGAIWVDNIAGTLTLANSIVTGNSTAANGGGITNWGTLNVIDSVVSNNSSGSSGGGIYNTGVATIIRSTISGNTASGNGGGIQNVGSSLGIAHTISIQESSLVNNSASGSGGGFSNESAATAVVQRSLITQNSAPRGAGVWVSGPDTVTNDVAIQNTTIANNAGAGVETDTTSANAHLHFATIAGNTTGMIAGAPNTVVLSRSLVANNPTTDCAGSIGMAAFNLIGQLDPGCSLVSQGSNDQVGTPTLPIDPLLGSLADNGGLTQTMALLPGSPAINAAGTAATACLPLDQRGVARPQGPQCDAGAFETTGVGIDPPGTIAVPLQLLGSADRASERLRLQPNTGGTGAGFWTTPARLDTDWSTAFTFQITEPVAWGGCACTDASADGLTFIIASEIPDAPGTNGSALGVSGLTQDYVAIEFDTFDASFAYSPSDDPDGNHVGIDLGAFEFFGAGSTTPAAPISAASSFVSPDFDNGDVWYVWFDYFAGDDIEEIPARIEVRVSTNPTEPSAPTVSLNESLVQNVGTIGYLGFTSSTGAARAVHDIIDWDVSGVVPATDGTLTVTSVTRDEPAVEAGYAVPLNAIPSERLLVGVETIAASPLGAIGDLSASPLGAIQLGAIPLGAIGGSAPIGQTLLSEIPITGGWAALLSGTPFEGRPLQTLTLDQVSGAIDPQLLAELSLGSIRVGASALGDLSVAALTLGDVPLSDMCGAGCPTESVLYIETSGGSLAGVPLGAIPLGAIPLGAIGTPTGAPLGAIPLGAIQLGAIPLGAIGDIAANPLGAIPLGAIGDLAGAPLGAIPLGAIPLGAIPLGAIPLGAIQLGAIPLGAIGGACDIVGCSSSGISESSTIDAYLASIGSTDIQDSPLGAIQLGAIPLGAIQLGAIPLGAIPLGAIPLGAIATGSTPLGAIPLGAIGLPDAASIVAACDDTTLTDCDGDTTLMEYAGAYTGSSLEGTPLGAIQLGAIPLGAIQLGAIQLGAITIAGLPLGAIELDSIDLVHSPLGAIPLGAIPLGAICGSSDTALTLREAASTGACGDATLTDLGEAVDGYVLDDILRFLTFGFLGQLDALEDLTYGEIITSILLSIDFPWEDLPLDEIETRDVACGYDRSVGGCTVGQTTTQPDLVSVDVTIDVIDGAVDGSLFNVTLPTGWLFMPGSAQITETIFDEAPIEITSPMADPLSQPSGQLTFIGSARPGTSTVSFAVAPDFTLGSGFAISADEVGGESPSTSATVNVTEGLEFGDVVANAQSVAADSLYVGYIRRSTDQDWWEIAAPAPGNRVTVYLSNLNGDVDTFIYRPETAPLGDNNSSRTIPLGTTPIPDEGIDFGGPATQSPELLSDSAVTQPAGSVLGDSSTNRGTDDEFAEFFSRSRDDGGNYAIQVAGFQGATSDSPYVLRVRYRPEVPTPACTPRNLGSIGGASLPAIPANVDTIFLVNWGRMDALFPGQVSTLPADLQAFASSTVGGVPVNGVVVPIGAIPGVIGTFDGWDANPCDPAAANSVVDLLVSYIQGVAATHPSLRHVTIVGSDEVIPLARLEDETVVANESTYVEGFADNALYGSQFTRHYQSDSPYGDLDPVPWLDRFAYLPDLGVGRLVETPSQIAGAITTFQSNGGLLDPQTSAAAGYDFLADGTQLVKDGLSGLTDLDSSNTLLSENWTRTDLANLAYGAPDGTAADVISPNAHYDHYRALPASENLNQTESDLFTINDVKALGDNALQARILFTMGCHSGLNVPNLASNANSEDWAEVYNAYRAVYIGNTGYGYGDQVTAALSELVMANLAANLGNGQTIGQHLSQAKQDQFGKAGLYGVYDLKAIEEATLYGLPFWRVEVPGAANAASNGTDTGPVAPDAATGILSAGFSTSPTFERVTVAGLGDYYTANGDTQFLHWRPIQPKATVDATQDGLIATGVLLTDLQTKDVDLPDAVFARPNTSDNTGREPEIEFPGTIFPTSFAAIGSSELLNPERTGGPSSLQQRVNILAGQYVGPLDIQRLFQRIDGQVFYADETDTVDWSAPTISKVTANVTGSQATFTVAATDGESGVERVVVLYRSSAAGQLSEWTAIDLIPFTGDTWAGGGTFETSLVPPIDYIVQAINADGVVGVSTFKGEFHKATVTPAGENQPPVLSDIVGPQGPVQLGTAVTVSSQVTDESSVTAVWSWGDGTTSAGTLNSTTISGTHTYAQPGVYRVQLVALDNAGASGHATYEFIVIYDPNGGFVTGGGWIDSPAGAYVADPSLTGKANFGFVSKYKKGQSIPDGTTTFKFKAAEFKFDSTSYEWLVIAGKKAQFKGSGTINGSGDYGFMLTAIDAALTPSTDVDLFRIKIWNKNAAGDEGDIIYDNKLGALDGADPTTEIASGSIVIHDGKKKK